MVDSMAHPKPPAMVTWGWTHHDRVVTMGTLPRNTARSACTHYRKKLQTKWHIVWIGPRVCQTIWGGPRVCQTITELFDIQTMTELFD